MGCGFRMSAPELARRSIATSGSRSGFRIGQGRQDGPEARDRRAASSVAAAVMLDEVDQKRTQSVDLRVAEAPPQLVLHLSALRERPLTDAFPGRAQVQPLLAAVARQLRALQVVQRHHVVHESAGGLFGDAEEFGQA